MFDAKNAVNRLLSGNRELWNQRLSAVRKNRVKSPKLNLNVLCMNWYNEVRAVDACADMVSRVESMRLKELLVKQVSDELKHAKIIRKYIAEKGGNVDTFSVPQQQVDLWDHLCSLNNPIQHFAGVNLVSEGMANDDLEEAPEGYYDKETSMLFEDHINRDESFHFKIGKLALAELLKSESDYELAKVACESTLTRYSDLVSEYERIVQENSE